MTNRSGITPIPAERIASLILHLRGLRVILDADLAVLYGVTTKALNQALKRNKKRFPSDFVLQLSMQEKLELVTNCDRFERLKHSTVLPHAFTEHGAVMAATIVNSDRAVAASVYVVRAFVRMRRMIARHAQLARKVGELERAVATHDVAIREIVGAIRELAEPPEQPAKERIGFRHRRH